MDPPKQQPLDDTSGFTLVEPRRSKRSIKGTIGSPTMGPTLLAIQLLLFSRELLVEGNKTRQPTICG
jgi:hypothetical protein